MNAATYVPTGSGASYLMMGTDVLITKISGADTEGQLDIIEGRCAPGGGPHLHTDPWRESFYVLEGALTFLLERTGRLEETTARRGDVITIPSGVGHGFRNHTGEVARFLVITHPAGLDRFFADAGEPIADPDTPPSSPTVNRARLTEAFRRHGLRPFEPTAPGK